VFAKMKRVHRKLRWVPFLNRILRKRHFLLVDGDYTHAMSEARGNKDEMEDHLNRTNLCYQYGIGWTCSFQPRFPFFVYTETFSGKAPEAFWDSLSPQLQKFYRELYKSGMRAYAYDVLFPPICDKSAMMELYDKFFGVNETEEVDLDDLKEVDVDEADLDAYLEESRADSLQNLQSLIK